MMRSVHVNINIALKALQCLPYRNRVLKNRPTDEVFILVVLTGRLKHLQITIRRLIAINLE